MKLHSSYRCRITWMECSEGALHHTVMLHSDMADFFLQLIFLNPDFFSAANPLGALRELEKLTLRTEDNPQPLFPFSGEYARYPSYLRRAAINFAFGLASSFFTLSKNAEKARAEGKKVAKPSLPTISKAYPVFYEKLQIQQVSDYSFRINVFWGNTWKWALVHVRHSDIDYIRHHCADREPESPRLAKFGKDWYIVFSFVEEVKLDDENIFSQTIVSVDLGINNACTCVVMKADGTVLARKFLKLGSEKAHLVKILSAIRGAKRRGVKRCRALWAKAKGINKEISVKTARFIMEVIQEAELKHGVKISAVVMEHLDLRGRKRGANRERLHHWRAIYVQQLVTDKAHRLGKRISRICAWNTSKLAFDGSGKVERDEHNYSLCTFRNGKRCNCDFSAAMNIGARYFVREIMKALTEKEQNTLCLERGIELLKKSLIGQSVRTAGAKDLSGASDYSRRTLCTYSTLRALNAGLRRLGRTVRTSAARTVRADEASGQKFPDVLR